MARPFARLRACCARCALATGKWLLTIFVGVAVFALAAQALAMVLASLALLLAALCLASLCMPEESRAVWAWMRETLGGWSRAGAEDGKPAAPSSANPAAQPDAPSNDGPNAGASAKSANGAAAPQTADSCGGDGPEPPLRAAGAGLEATVRRHSGGRPPAGAEPPAA